MMKTKLEQEIEVMKPMGDARRKSEEIKERIKEDYYDNLLDEINRGLHESE